MTNSVQHRGWVSSVGSGTASAALSLAVVLVLGVVTTRSVQAQTFTVLYKFTGPPDGASPYAGLVRDAAGNLYGTTQLGGAAGGYGTVFKVDKTGKETVLHSFTGGKDGGYPFAGLVRDTAGNLYGTTTSGGDLNCGDHNGCGTVFKVDTCDKETVLHSFAGGASDGAFPFSGVSMDAKGNLYGDTKEGGPSNLGTVYKLGRKGALTVLHSFAGPDGAGPSFGDLLMDTKGNLYGTTIQGGFFGYGTVYKLARNRALTVLHSFSSDGCFAATIPAMDTKGNLYGTLAACGAFGSGSAWKISRKGSETVLHSFAGGSSDGAAPYGGVILDTKGNLYGDTFEGGPSNLGTVYELNEKGRLNLLYSFDAADGLHPLGGLVRDAKGNFYGTTYEGGDLSFCNFMGCGTVWKLTP
jgi:uncharacterized repeat protein (TIGR03803 family)